MKSVPRSFRFDDMIWEKFITIADKLTINRTAWFEKQMEQFIEQNNHILEKDNSVASSNNNYQVKL